MTAARIKKLALRLSNDAFAHGCADANGFTSAAHAERLKRVRQASMQALLDAIDAALPTLPAAAAITLDSLETTEAEARTPGALWLDIGVLP